MIKVFRQIRQQLFMEGKTGKYLKYAIGEIILVVIGILIALQINNWNNGRVEKKSDYQSIRALISDLKAKDEEIISDFEYGKSLISQTDIIIDHWAKYKSIDTLNLKRSIFILSGDGAFFIEKSPALESLTNSDLWERLPDSLLKQVDDVYRGNFTGLKAAYEKITEYSTQFKFDFLIPNGLADSSLSTEEIHLLIKDNSIEYISYLEVYRDGILRLNSRFKQASEGIDLLIDDLNVYQHELKE
ncbi:DUF6090 family protein [Cryomorphaceae bacterium 1068]|nr:DUF6090 family protein [Cryomorphaceae bacterium 1068]